MFETDIEIVIRRPGPPRDGVSVYTEIPTRALQCERELRGSGDPPAVKYATVFLVPPPEMPRIGDSIVCGGRSHTVSGIRICRDLDGRIVAARCTTE